MLQKIQAFLRDTVQERSDAPDGPSPARLATLALLVELSRADFEVTPTELSAIETAGARLLRSSLDEARALLAAAREQADESVSLYDFTAEIHNELDADEKAEVVLELWRVAWADGEIHPYEDHLVRKVAGLLHVPHDRFIEAKLAARDEVAD